MRGLPFSMEMSEGWVIVPISNSPNSKDCSMWGLAFWSLREKYCISWNLNIWPTNMHITLTDDSKVSYLKKHLCHMLVHKCIVNNLYFFPICLLTIHEDRICPVMGSYKVDFAHRHPFPGRWLLWLLVSLICRLRWTAWRKDLCWGSSWTSPGAGKGDPGMTAEVLGNSDSELCRP